MLKLKLQYFGHLMRRADSFEKTLILGKDSTQEEKGMTEDDMTSGHQWFNGHESESEVAQSCPTLHDPRDCSPPGSSVHVFSRQEYWSGVPLPSPILIWAILNINTLLVGMEKHAATLKDTVVLSLAHQVAKVLELQLQHQSFQWTFRTDFL